MDCLSGLSPETIPDDDDTRICLSTDWKVYSHCAAITRIYALFERFIADLGEIWLKALPIVTGTYTHLPEKLKDQHRLGVLKILTKLGQKRYNSLSALSLVRGLYAGLAHGTSYELPISAFIVEDRNLRMKVLYEFFTRIGIDNLKEMLAHHPDLLAFMEKCFGDQQTADALLENLVDYRNEASHGHEVLEVFSSGELVELAEFILCLAKSIAETVDFHYCTRRRLLYPGIVCGKVTEYFKQHDAYIVKVNSIKLEKDGFCTLLNARRYHRAKILSLQDNGVNVDALEVTSETEIGVCFDRRVSKGSNVINLDLDDYSRFRGESI